MSNLTFLEQEQIFGDKQLDIFKKRGTKASITDFAIILGGYKSLEDRTGKYWTKTFGKIVSLSKFIVDEDGKSRCNMYDDGTIGARLVLPLSSFSEDIIGIGMDRGYDGVLEIKSGYYPQKAVSIDMQNILENVSPQKTGNKYTVNAISASSDDYRLNFKPQSYDEYEFEDKRYIRAIVNDKYSDNECTLSNGMGYNSGETVWIEVKPVKWLVDEKEKIMVTENILFAGVPFDFHKSSPDDFNKTNIMKFMTTYLVKEMFQTNDLNLDIDVEKENVDNKRNKNPYGFNFNEVSEEDIIKGAVQSNIAVFLHGRSSEGKSARVKQLDPDCEIIYLRNATPESLNGKTVYNSETGEMIDVKPTWLLKLEEKCSKEKDKIHILFFDEITNALPSIQGMAFNIILDKEVNGKWKLPDNARIVAAGNDLNDSLAANTMAEPLFNRFAHVYINTTVESWLEWASTPKEKYERLDYINKEPEMKIHPAIYAFISYKAGRGKDVLRTPYNGEKPNADPRKWEMASKMLYSTGRPKMLRSLIGEDLTDDFIGFSIYNLITVEDVIKGNYTERDLEMNISAKYATAVGLSVVDEENLEVVREFVEKLGTEVLTVFDNLWIRGDEKRLERIAELRTNLIKVKRI